MKDARVILDAVGMVLRELFGKRDAQTANLQQRVDALEERVAELEEQQEG